MRWCVRCGRVLNGLICNHCGMQHQPPVRWWQRPREAIRDLRWALMPDEAKDRRSAEKFHWRASSGPGTSVHDYVWPPPASATPDSSTDPGASLASTEHER